jgi:hypothetical protein
MRFIPTVPMSLDNSMVAMALPSGTSLDIDMALVIAQISLNDSVVTAEQISFGGFFTNALKLMDRIDDVAVAELVIIAAPALALALALNSIVTPAWMSTPILLAEAPRYCALGAGVLRLSRLLPCLIRTLYRSSPVHVRFIFLLFRLLFLFPRLFFPRLYRFRCVVLLPLRHVCCVAFASPFFSSACYSFP